MIESLEKSNQIIPWHVVEDHDFAALSAKNFEFIEEMNGGSEFVEGVDIALVDEVVEKVDLEVSRLVFQEIVCEIYWGEFLVL